MLKRPKTAYTKEDIEAIPMSFFDVIKVMSLTLAAIPLVALYVAVLLVINMIKMPTDLVQDFTFRIKLHKLMRIRRGDL